MGPSHAVLFGYFPSRGALWAESVRWATGQKAQGFTALADQGGTDPLLEVEQPLLVHTDVVCRYPGLLCLVFAEVQEPQARPARQDCQVFMARYRQRLISRLTAATEKSSLPFLLPPPALANVLLACCEGLMLQALIHGALAELGERIHEALPLLLTRAAG